MSRRKDIQGYLSDMLLHCQRILEATNGDFDTFAESWLIQDAVIRNFEVLGEIAKRIDAAFKEQHPEIPWRSVKAFRDVLVHDYEDLRVEIVWQTISNDIPALQNALEAALASLPPEEDVP